MILKDEEIIETKSCEKCQVSFDITDKDLEFYEQVSPIFGGEKYSIPSPRFCPECRQQRRLSWRNERSLYKRKCDATGKDIVSVYNPDTPYKVYNNHFWWSDNWDPMEYEQEYDFDTSFFQQFKELYTSIPQIPIVNDDGVQSENCGYCQDFAFGKNCYLVMGGWQIQDSMYSTNCNHSRNIVDSNTVNLNCDGCYECINCEKISKAYFLQNCVESSNCFFGFNLRGCRDCIGCVNLVNKQYCIFNKQYSKESYLKQEQEMLQGGYSKLVSIRGEYQNILDSNPKLSGHMTHCENCIGDFLYNCKNSYAFDTFHAEDSKFFNRGDHPKRCYDIIQSGNSELCYDCITPDDSYQVCFSNWCWKSKNILYSDNCHSSKNLFGCIGLKSKQYCILNKQYSKEKYEKLIPKIIEKMIENGEWGEFFPSNISPFGYNETIASEYYPLTKQQSEQQGFNWSDYKAPFPKVDKTIPANKLPDNIADIPDDILNWAIECEVTDQPFKIIKSELDFYRKHKLPIPRRHPDRRHLDRISLRNPRKLFERSCDKCNKKIQTTYSPKKSEMVYCEQCYNKEIY